ncbi:MAG: nucleotide exchange factor GrpE [Planctomycetaceae bacterium]|nr:nucleotide exchange factor GrpE [Planctomycetaceae bacterium]
MSEELPPDELSPSSADDSEQQPLEEDVADTDPLATLAAERDDLRDKLFRLHAEMENFRKRVNRERDEERKYAGLPIARDLLSTLDNLHRAIDAGEKSEGDHGELLQGVRMVATQIDQVLQQHGIVPIPALGEPFDPNVHEALQQVPSADHPPMTVIQEYERGYKLHDRVIRPSKVIVSMAPPS